MKVDRRLIVMRTVGPNGVIKASEIAKKTGRSLQNISYAIRELEKCGLIRCITPNKPTWKTFIFTKQGVNYPRRLSALADRRSRLAGTEGGGLSVMMGVIAD